MATSIESVVDQGGGLIGGVSTGEDITLQTTQTPIESTIDDGGNLIGGVDQEEYLNPIINEIPLLEDLVDVDIVTNGRLDGSVLVYQSNTNKWTSTKLLNKQTVDAGEY